MLYVRIADLQNVINMKQVEKKIDKRKIVERLTNPPEKTKPFFWAKEMTIFKRLLVLYPDLNFWDVVTFNGEVKSMAQLTVWPYEDEVEFKYKQFNFVIEKKEEIKVGETVGSDIIIEKQKTMKDFLYGEKERS